MHIGNQYIYTSVSEYKVSTLFLDTVHKFWCGYLIKGCVHIRIVLGHCAREPSVNIALACNFCEVSEY